MQELDDWVGALATELGFDPSAVDVEGVLDLAGDAAHNVVRPAAPVTTFVAGYLLGLATARAEADARSGAAPSSTAPSSDDLLDRIGALARAWTPPA